MFDLTNTDKKEVLPTKLIPANFFIKFDGRGFETSSIGIVANIANYTGSKDSYGYEMQEVFEQITLMNETFGNLIPKIDAAVEAGNITAEEALAHITSLPDFKAQFESIVKTMIDFYVKAKIITLPDPRDYAKYM